MPFGSDPSRQFTATAPKSKLVIDSLTGEEIPEEELFWRDQLRQAVVTGELFAALNDDGDWEIGLPDQQESLIKPPSLEGASLKAPTPPPTLGQTPTEPPAIKVPEEPVEASGESTLDFNPRLIEKLSAQPVIPQIRQEREAMTGETDPIIQDNIFKALDGLPLAAQQELLAYYRQARLPKSEIKPPGTVGAPTGIEGLAQGLSRDEAWQHMLDVGREQLTGNVSQPAWEAFADRAAGAALDPVTTAGKAVLGEQRWESLPDPVKTAAQWAPILVAPQKGLIKDLTIGGAGPRAGALAIGGAVAGEQVADLTGLNQTVLEFAGAIVSPVLLAKRWTAVENAIRDSRASLDEGIDDAAAWDLHAQFEGVRDAKPDDLVTVYHATDETSARDISQNGFRVNSFVTTDPESGILHAMEKRGVSNPTLISFQVPRSLLRQSKANPIVFTNNQVLRPVTTEVQDGFIENAAQAVRDFLRVETGAIRVPFGQEPIPDEVARVAFGSAVPETPKISAEEVLNQIRSAAPNETVQFPNGVTVSRLQGSDAVLVHSPRFGDEVLNHPGDVAETINTNAPEFSVDTLRSSDDALLNLRDELGAFSEDELRRSYQHSIASSDGARDVLEISPRMEDPSLRETYMRSLENVRRYGEELYRRTDGKEGLMPRMARAFEQFIAAEEGAIRVPNIQIGPTTPSRVVQPHPSTNVVSHFGLKPVVPHLTKAEKLGNIVKSGLNTNIFGALSDPLGTRIAQGRRAADAVNESLSNRATSRIEYLVERAFNREGFKIDKNTQRIKGLPSEPTMQDLAAKWPEWRPILTDRQNQALSVIREELDSYYKDLIEQGVELHTRADVIDGGFYIPRGRADKLAEDGITVLYDEPRVGPGGRGGKMSAEKPAVFDSMTEGIEAGYKYHPFGESMHTYFIDAGRRSLDSYYANVLKNSVDDAGTPLGQTPHARLLADPENKMLVSRMERLRKDVSSLSRSVDGMDDRLHGIWANFAHSPAPDLDNLAYAMRNLFTSGGKLRVRGAQKLTLDDLREAVGQEVFINRGKYAHGARIQGKRLTQEQLRKQVLRDAVERVKIRQGQFKGMSFEEGTALLNRIKSTIAGIQPDYSTALKKAQQTPRGQMTMAPTGMGANLANHTFDWQLASVINDYLKPTHAGGVVGVTVDVFIAVNNILRMMRATADFSMVGIQGLPSLFYQPNSYRRAMGAAFRAMFDPVAGRDILGKFIDDFDRRAVREGLPTSREWASAGLLFGGLDTEFTTGKGIGRLPIVHQANRGFGYFGDVLRLDGANAMFKGRERTAAGTAQRTGLMKEIAHGENLMTGWSPQRVGGDAGSIALFAPRFFDSQIRLVANALTNKQVTGQMARGMFRNMIGGGVLLTVAVNESLNNDGFDYLTPKVNGRWNPNFMRMRVPEFGDVSIFGPWDSLLKAVAAGIGEGDPFYTLRTKASPMVSMIWDTLSGESFVGDKAPRIQKLVQDTIGEIRSVLTGTGYEASGDFGLMQDYVIRSFLPFSVAEQAADLVAGKIGLKEFATETAKGSSGIKVSPLSNSEQMDQLRRDTVLALINDGTIPPEKAELYKNTPFHELLSGERKIIDRAIQERQPELWEDYKQARRDYGSIYQAIGDQADGARESMKADYDKLMEQLLAGENPRIVMEALDKLTNQLSGRLSQIYEGGVGADGKIVSSAETKQYVDEVAKLPLNDMRRIEFEYNAITTEVFESRGGALRDSDWDAIANKQADFIQKLGDADPTVAQRFVDNLVLKEQFSIEDAHPIVQLKKITNELLTPYYDIPEEDSAARSAWLTANPQADFMRWMTAGSDSPTLNSPAAAVKALSELPTREIEVKLASGKTTTLEGVRLANTRTVITDQNLPIVQKYAKEITQLMTIPTSAVDPRNGREYNPREVLREQVPVYDALYFWLGFSGPNVDGTVSVYHPNAVYELIQQWGQRSDRARIKGK